MDLWNSVSLLLSETQIPAFRLSPKHIKSIRLNQNISKYVLGIWKIKGTVLTQKVIWHPNISPAFCYYTPLQMIRLWNSRRSIGCWQHPDFYNYCRQLLSYLIYVSGHIVFTTCEILSLDIYYQEMGLIPATAQVYRSHLDPIYICKIDFFCMLLIVYFFKETLKLNWIF